MGLLLSTKRVSGLLSFHAIKATVFVGLLVQLGRPLISLLTLPLLLSHLGQEGLGVWMIALSLMGLIGFVSSGLSASVVTATGRASIDSSQNSIGRLATAASLIASFWGLVTLVFAVPAALLVDWPTLLRSGESLSDDDISRLMVSLTVLLASTLITSVPRQIMLGRMHGYLAHMLDLSGVVAGALGLIIGIYFAAPLWVLGVAFMGPSVMTTFIGGYLYMRRADIPLLSRQNIDWPTIKMLGRDSLGMAGYHGAYAVSSQSDLLLIGIVLGAPESASYGIALRVFAFPVLLSTTVNYAQWPAMARWDAAGEHGSVGCLFRRTLVIGTGSATALATGFALMYEPLVKLWLGSYIYTDYWILSGMVAWVLIATLVNTCDSLLRARQETAFLVRCMIAMAAINIVTTLLLLPIIGPAGAIWGSVAGYAIALLLPYMIRLRGLIQIRCSA